MNFDLTEDQRKLQATVADFAQSEVAPVAEALDRDGVFPTELFKKAGELGITAIPFSEDLGGMGLGVLDMVIALELVQIQPGLEPDLLDEPAPRVAVGGECVRLAAVAIQGRHQ